jgi:ribonuclease Z
MLEVMRVIFLGTGEAYAHKRNNTSILVEGKEHLLLDCGFTTSSALGRYNGDKNFIDYVFISHFHGDHVAGIPLLCMKWRQEGRSRPLTILGGKNIEPYFYQLFEMLFKGFSNKCTFPIQIIEVFPGHEITLGSFRLGFTNGKHLTGETEVEDIAIRVTYDEKAIVYSGDTVYSRNVEKLANGCDLLIHEAYMTAGSPYHAMKSHCSPLEAGKTAKGADVKKLALIHIHREYSEKTLELISEASQEFKGDIVVPEDMDIIEIRS